ncbi:MAG TPA: OmpA family protein [Spirochaetota bacterium]|nr:OmpA family protein [Spirochaetota bacterium]
MKKYAIVFGILFICMGFIIMFGGCATQEEAVKEEAEQPKEEVSEAEPVEKPVEAAEPEEKDIEIVQRIDSDGDGIYDDADQCAESPAGVQVDEFGCPKDSDKDGVYDGIDKCPGTVRGVPVDSMGCPAAKPSGKTARYKLVLEFDSDSSSVRPIYYIQFKNRFEEIKKANPYLEVLRVEVKGHSDGTGIATYNFALSQRRAQAVRTFIFSQFGVDPGSIKVQAFGEKSPVASNRSRSGRQKNRRVEVYVTVKNLDN